MKRPANESNVGWAAREGRLQDAMERVVGTGETKGNKGIRQTLDGETFGGSLRSERLLGVATRPDRCHTVRLGRTGRPTIRQRNTGTALNPRLVPRSSGGVYYPLSRYVQPQVITINLWR
jgi:hypothetical protein